ncbi:TPA: hypothetical protein ACOJ5U_001859 [Streptococcus pneumoniae]|nr:hypothetical protein [Streptococcus pneumoniae]BBG82075.1 hypothetical protein ASP0581_15530 [Streptococcus pneumoniae]VMB77621.1 serine/threonine protein kinase [Streptococcus pneumoniae]VNA33273.1 serine/threonine protein kinase [Streptococcus pneumoniae]VPF45712.1 serine/threonine protein kinase [Streptococcus pneumoniae]
MKKNKKVIYLLLNEKRKNYVEDKRQNFPSLPNWKMDLFSEEEKGIIFKPHVKFQVKTLQ